MSGKRPEDPGVSVREFASDLRELRATAGSPSFRQLAAMTRYSRTALSNALKGRQLPSLRLTLALVRACGGDPDAWTTRWRRVSTLHDGPAPPHVTFAASPWPAEPVADGASPEATGCGTDAITVHARKIALVDRRQIIGQVELRYSSNSRAAWGRFKGYPGLDHLGDRRHVIEIDVQVTRDIDGALMSYRAPYAFDAHYCGILRTGAGVFHASVDVYFDSERVATGSTDQRALP